MATGQSEAEPFWAEFLRSLTRRGLRGVKLVTSAANPEGFGEDAHEGSKAAANRVPGAAAQRGRVHFPRNAMAHAGRSQRRVVSASRKSLRGFAGIGTAFAQNDAAAARQRWRAVADPPRPRLPRLAELMDGAEHGVLTSMDVPAAHRTKLHSTNGNNVRRYGCVGPNGGTKWEPPKQVSPCTPNAAPAPARPCLHRAPARRVRRGRLWPVQPTHAAKTRLSPPQDKPERGKLGALLVPAMPKHGGDHRLLVLAALK